MLHDISKTLGELDFEPKEEISEQVEGYYVTGNGDNKCRLRQKGQAVRRRNLAEIISQFI